MDFQDELNKVSRSKEEYEKTEYEKRFEYGQNRAVWCFEEIQKELLRMASSGQYQTVSNKKIIRLDYEISYPSDIGLKLNVQRFDFGKTIFNRHGKSGVYIKYDIVDKGQYEGFISRIKELSQNDNMSTEIRAVDKKISGIEFVPTLGCRTQSATIECFLKLIIRYSVEY